MVITTIVIMVAIATIMIVEAITITNANTIVIVEVVLVVGVRVDRSDDHDVANQIRDSNAATITKATTNLRATVDKLKYELLRY